ncbi:MAG: hypothetical protein BroJett011_00740 [Chloroflexota bacterium]|nr:MAG: hypothetical protein BroJett011_00740 [Chloroflexota bacterium]
MKYYQVMRWGQRVSVAVLLALLLVGVSLAVLVWNAAAGAKGKGPGCGGDLLDGTEQNGDLILLLNSGGGSWESGGPTISKNLQIEGGWKLKTGEICSSNQTYTDTSKFEFIGPLTRSVASESDDGPVITIAPSVLTLTIKHVIFDQQGAVLKGGGINGVISNGATILLENLAFVDGGGTADNGAGLYLEVRGNSHLVLSGTQFLTNTAQETGGGFEIHVFDGSQVTFYNPEVRGNRSLNGNGGGGRIVIHRGTVSIIGGTFSNNFANQGRGGGLAVEATGGGPAVLILQNPTFSGNTASFSNPDLFTSGPLAVLDKTTFLPIVRKNS